MLAHHDDGRVGQHSAGIEVVEQRREGVVEARPEFVLQSRRLVDVRVPAGVHQAVLVPAHRHELPARLEHAPRRQARLAEERHPVAVAELGRLALDIQSVAELAGREHGPSQGAMAVERCLVRGGVERTPRGIELIEERGSTVQAVERDGVVWPEMSRTDRSAECRGTGRRPLAWAGPARRSRVSPNASPWRGTRTRPYRKPARGTRRTAPAATGRASSRTGMGSQ